MPNIISPPGAAGQTQLNPPELVMEVVRAIGTLQPTWVDGGHSLRWAASVAQAFRNTVGAATLPHHCHALWLLEAALEWAERDGRYGDPPRYLSPDECGWCRPQPHQHTWVSGLMYVSGEDFATVARMRAELGEPLPTCETCGASYAVTL